jgi:hypothetical protein
MMQNRKHATNQISAYKLASQRHWNENDEDISRNIIEMVELDDGKSASLCFGLDVDTSSSRL